MTLSASVSPICLMQWLVIGLLSPVPAGISSVRANILVGMSVPAASCIRGNLLKKTGLIRV